MRESNSSRQNYIQSTTGCLLKEKNDFAMKIKVLDVFEYFGFYENSDNYLFFMYNGVKFGTYEIMNK